MSYPSGFSRLHISDEVTHRMSRGKDNMGSHVVEGPSSTSSGDALSCVDTTRVITWLRPVRECQEMHYGRNFPFLLMSGFSYLKTSVCRLCERGSRWNEFHPLVEDSY